MIKFRRVVRTAAAMTSLAAAAGSMAQTPGFRSDSIEATRTKILAGVLGSKSSARSGYDARVQFAAGGSHSCELNIGDVRGAKGADADTALGQSFERRGLARTQYVTVVDAPVMCITR